MLDGVTKSRAMVLVTRIMRLTFFANLFESPSEVEEKKPETLLYFSSMCIYVVHVYIYIHTYVRCVYIYESSTYYAPTLKIFQSHLIGQRMCLVFMSSRSKILPVRFTM